MNPTESRILVRKYGGSSLATVERIGAVARDIRRARDEGFQVVAVVSAMGRTTDDLAALAHEVSPCPPRRELDMLLSVGERITMSLLSMALAHEGCSAISLTGSQCGIITDTSHTDARILEVRGDRVRQGLAAGHIVIVAGFQGVSLEKEITTLGRGGSDTTAVALAAALGAVRCEILKDVDGVMSADPRTVPEARAHQDLSYDELCQIAAAGCGVVHLQAAEYAARHGVTLVVRSSFHDAPGTRIGAVADGPCERPASDRESRYRPLTLIEHRNVTRLRLSADDAERGRRLRDLVLARQDPAVVIAEWLDAGAGLRWEALAPGAAVADLVRELQEQRTRDPEAFALQVETGMTCLSLAGGRPDSWLEVQRHLGDLLTEIGMERWQMRADGAALRILCEIPPESAQLARLHRELLPE